MHALSRPTREFERGSLHFLNGVNAQDWQDCKVSKSQKFITNKEVAASQADSELTIRHSAQFKFVENKKMALITRPSTFDRPSMSPFKKMQYGILYAQRRCDHATQQTINMTTSPFKKIQYEILYVIGAVSAGDDC